MLQLTMLIKKYDNSKNVYSQSIKVMKPVI